MKHRPGSGVGRGGSAPGGRPRWEEALAEGAREALGERPEWSGAGTGTRGLHLAVFVEPYLRYVLEGRKTVESRFSANRCAPYRKVAKGDVVLLKRSGGPVVAACEVTEAWFYDLDPASWSEVRGFAKALCADGPEFWESRRRASVATLMRIGSVTPFARPLPCGKRDRRGWVVLAAPPPACEGE